MKNIMKLIFAVALVLAGPAGCIATYETPPPPRDAYMFMNGRTAYVPVRHRRPRPMFDRRPAEHPAAKHPVRPAGAMSVGHGRGLPPTVR